MSGPILILIVMACFAPFLFVVYCWPLISSAKRAEIVSAPKVRSPLPGELWQLDGNDGSPWPKDCPYLAVKILDVRDGWVRYDMGGAFRDSRLSANTFLKLYQPCKEAA